MKTLKKKFSREFSFSFFYPSCDFQKKMSFLAISVGGGDRGGGAAKCHLLDWAHISTYPFMLLGSGYSCCLYVYCVGLCNPAMSFKKKREKWRIFNKNCIFDPLWVEMELWRIHRPGERPKKAGRFRFGWCNSRQESGLFPKITFQASLVFLLPFRAWILNIAWRSCFSYLYISCRFIFLPSCYIIILSFCLYLHIL